MSVSRQITETQRLLVRCDNCKYWEPPDEKGDPGVCCLNPPVPAVFELHPLRDRDNIDRHTGSYELALNGWEQPDTYPGEACGQFSARPAQSPTELDTLLKDLRELRFLLNEIFIVLATSERLGAKEDKPEGQRYIQISDTLAQQFADRLTAVLYDADEDHPAAK